MKMKKAISSIAVACALSVSLSANALVIIDNNTGGHYNNGIGDMADYYGPTQFPGANSSEGDPNINPIAEPTTFSAAFGNDWLNNDYSGAGNTWGTSTNIPNNWAVNTETAIVYDFLLAGASDLHIDLGVDNGVFVWIDGNYVFGAMRGGGSSINEYDIDLAGISAGAHSIQILREDHGGGTGYDILVDAKASTVSEPATFALLGLGLAGLGFARKQKKA
jgi:hypothetical protein